MNNRERLLAILGGQPPDGFLKRFFGGQDAANVGREVILVHGYRTSCGRCDDLTLWHARHRASLVSLAPPTIRGSQ